MLAPANYCFLHQELFLFSVCLQPVKKLHSAPLKNILYYIFAAGFSQLQMNVTRTFVRENLLHYLFCYKNPSHLVKHLGNCVTQLSIFVSKSFHLQTCSHSFHHVNLFQSLPAFSHGWWFCFLAVHHYMLWFCSSSRFPLPPVGSERWDSWWGITSEQRGAVVFPSASSHSFSR